MVEAPIQKISVKHQASSDVWNSPYYTLRYIVLGLTGRGIMISEPLSSLIHPLYMVLKKKKTQKTVLSSWFKNPKCLGDAKNLPGR